MVNREKVTSRFIDMVKISSPSLKERDRRLSFKNTKRVRVRSL